MSQPAQTDEKILKYLEGRQTIIGELGTSEDVAEGILYLATSPFVTGSFFYSTTSTLRIF